MQVAFLSRLIPPNMYEEVKVCSRRNMQDAANALQWHIYEGLSSNLKEQIKLFNVLPIGSFPQYYNKAFIVRNEFSIEGNINVNIGFCNVKGLKRYLLPFNIYNELKKWCASPDEDKLLFVYTISDFFVIAIEKIKKKYPKLKVCAVVADLPNMTNLTIKKTFIQKKIENNFMRKVSCRLEHIDYFVLLTKYMADYLHINCPFCVMEGIATEEFPVYSDVSNEKVKTVLYTGTLNEKFGIMTLLEAFEKIEDKDYRLVICGIGDCEYAIEQAAKRDQRIVYKGQLTREEVLKLQKESTVLINPRQNIEEFTKYSFPSKNLEYLSTGKPLIAYKLDGIPDEYDPYIFYVKDNSAEALKEKIVQVCSFQEEAIIKSVAGREFVLRHKNSVVQTRRVLEMINEAGMIISYENSGEEKNTFE